MGKSFEVITRDRYHPGELEDISSEGELRYISASVKKANSFAKELGPQIGLTSVDDIYHLRRKFQERKEIPDLKNIPLDINTVNEIRERYGFTTLSQEQYDAITSSSQEILAGEEEAQEPQIQDTEIIPENQIPQELSEDDDSQTIHTAEEIIPSADDSLISPEVEGEHEPQNTRDAEVTLESEVSPEEVEEERAPTVEPELDQDKGDIEGLLDAVAHTLKQEMGDTKELEAQRIDIIQEERLTDAQKLIEKYQEFAQNHPAHTRDQAMHEQFRRLEQEAWEAQRLLAHSNGGEITTLPQKRDIELSHPETVNIRGYLESMGYEFDKNGDITHITNRSDVIELNRPYSIDNLINTPRPSHILYDKNVNLDNRSTLSYYHGHLIRGLNQHTPQFIISTLGKDEFIQGVIVDESSIEHKDPLSGEDISQYANSDISVEEMKVKRNELVQAKASVSQEELVSPEEAVITPPIDGELSSAEVEASSQNRLDSLRVAYARAEEFYNRNRRDEEAKLELERLRNEYNQEVEKVLGIMVAEGVESEIHAIFTKEVYNLREARITQSKELQSGFERKINPIKERLLNFAIKNKKFWAGINISLAVAGGFFALSGAGLPVAGALEATRRSIASVMAGVSAREGTRALLEDADVKLGKLKWQSVIPKLVSESLKDGYIDAATDTDLSAKLSTLEAYYRLNGGKFTNDSQQKAYEAILMKLGEKVQEKTIENNQPKENNDSKLMQGEEGKETSSSTDSEFNNTVSTPEQKQARYTSELLKIMSEKRISELQKQQKKRLIANIVGTAVGGGLMTSLAVDMMRPGGALNPDQASAISKPEVEPISPNLEEVGGTSETAKAMAQNLSPEQLQDISELDSGETLWSEMAKRFGENATDAQIQQGVEAYMNTSQGQETMFSLASQTEGGRALLSQWGIDNAAELSQVPKTDLFELSRHLGVGELRGLDTLDITNLPPLDETTIPEGFNPTESPSSGVTPPGPGAESVSQVDKNVFMSQVAETLGIDKVNLTETEFTNIMYSYLETEQGRDALYNLALSDESGKTLLEQFGVYSIEDFNRLSPTELYNLSQSVDLNNLEGFNFNDIMLSKFENAPDSITLMKGTGPLTQVNQYIDMYAGGLPYDATLGQEVLNTYINTPAGKNWLYDAIVNNPNPNDQNVQLFREYLSYKGIKSAEDFSKMFNWADFSSDNRIPTSGFWRPVKLPNTTITMQPLSTFLQPSKMTGIKEVVRQVLTR